MERAKSSVWTWYYQLKHKSLLKYSTAFAVVDWWGSHKENIEVVRALRTCNNTRRSRPFFPYIDCSAMWLPWSLTCPDAKGYPDDPHLSSPLSLSSSCPNTDLSHFLFLYLMLLLVLSPLGCKSSNLPLYAFNIRATSLPYSVNDIGSLLD